MKLESAVVWEKMIVLRTKHIFHMMDTNWQVRKLIARALMHTDYCELLGYLLQQSSSRNCLDLCLQGFESIQIAHRKLHRFFQQIQVYGHILEI